MSPMPNSRKKGQKFVGFQADEELVTLVDTARGREDKSRWLRRAIIAQLRAEGLKVDADLELAPSRAGVGGPRAHEQNSDMALVAETPERSKVPKKQRSVDYRDLIKPKKGKAK